MGVIHAIWARKLPLDRDHELDNQTAAGLARLLIFRAAKCRAGVFVVFVKEFKMSRVTEKQLDAIANRINTMCGAPLAPYVNGVAQIGCAHISHAYGGVALHRMTNASGGACDVFGAGHMPKKELAARMFSYIAGLQDCAEMMRPQLQNVRTVLTRKPMDSAGAVMALDSIIGE